MAIRIAHMKDHAPATATIPMTYGTYELLAEDSYHGCVVATGEHNGYDDSDFFAIVWDAEKGDFKEVTYASTRGWSYANSAKVDAPAELIEAYRAKCAAEAKARAIARAKRDIYNGATVVVIKGRKVAKGTTGRVCWIGPDKFRRDAKRIGFIPAGSKDMVFTTSENLEVVVDAA